MSSSDVWRQLPASRIIFQPGRSLEVEELGLPGNLFGGLAATPAKSADLGVFFVPTSAVALSACCFHLFVSSCESMSFLRRGGRIFVRSCTGVSFSSDGMDPYL